jgi:hypothetical protein
MNGICVLAHRDGRSESHLFDLINTYFGRRRNTLQGLTPYEFIVKAWTNEPEQFRLDPIHQMPGLNS